MVIISYDMTQIVTFLHAVNMTWESIPLKDFHCNSNLIKFHLDFIHSMILVTKILHMPWQHIFCGKDKIL